MAIGENKQLKFLIICLLVMVVLINSCASPTILDEPEDLPTPTAVSKTVTPVPTPTPTAIPEPLSLFLAEPLPADIITHTAIIDIKLSNDPGSQLWFGPDGERPEGNILETATWVYALVAPFPTLKDQVSLVDFQAFWIGDVEENPLSSLTSLYVPETLVRILDSRWGPHATNTVTAFKNQPDIDQLWDENAWAVLPFEALSPRLKVIYVDDISPLFKDFDPKKYPLTVQYSLVQNENTSRELTASEHQILSSAIQPTNRDHEKMTTLVMTGVTALVRAIAYRMEIHGVHYPAEEIGHWLSEADLTHISNEVSFYEDCPFPDPDNPNLVFCSDPKYIELLEFVGADIIELTGNHNNDMLYLKNVDTVPFTLDLYQERGMAYYGGGLNIKEAKAPLFITHNGNQFAFIGCNSFGPEWAWATEEKGGAAPCEDFQWMADEINRLEGEGYIPIATFQYFEDYHNYPLEKYHVRDFGMMADAGAVIVNGSQAHRPKAMDFRNNAFIDYGLGNLFFDQMLYRDPISGLLIEQVRWVMVQRHTFYDGRHLSVELLTAMNVDYAQPRPMTPSERLVFLEELFSASGWESR